VVGGEFVITEGAIGTRLPMLEQQNGAKYQGQVQKEQAWRHASCRGKNKRHPSAISHLPPVSQSWKLDVAMTNIFSSFRHAGHG